MMTTAARLFCAEISPGKQAGHLQCPLTTRGRQKTDPPKRNRNADSVLQEHTEKGSGTLPRQQEAAPAVICM